MTTSHRDPHALAEELGINIVYRKLAARLHAYWDGEQIFIDPRLSQRQERCALAHDLMHVKAGDKPFLYARHSPCAEARRDKEAAEFLIEPNELYKLAAAYPNDPHQIARELGVTDRILHAWLLAHPISIETSEGLVA